MENPKLGNLARTFMCSVVFIDIVEYSKRTVAKQLAQKGWLNELLTDALKGILPSDRVVLDTGDGAAICFLGDPEEALFVTSCIRVALAAGEYPEFTLRIGVNLGPVKAVKDLNGQPNIIGDGINVAQRVMSFAQPNQILVSRSYYEVVSRLSEDYAKVFRFLGEHQDKHVRSHEVYEICMSRDRPEPDAADAPDEPVVEMPPESHYASAPARRVEREGSDIDEPFVAAVGAALTKYLGPIAPLHARKTAQKIRWRAELVRTLAESIPESRRAAFLDEVSRTAPLPVRPREPGSVADPARGPSGPAQAEPGTVFDESDLQRLEKLLASHVGPMARVLVKGAAKTARSRHELVAALAAAIDAPRERDRFEAAVAGAFATRAD